MYKHDHEQTVKFHSHDLCYNKMQMNSVYLFFMLYRKKKVLIKESKLTILCVKIADIASLTSL